MPRPKVGRKTPSPRPKALNLPFQRHLRPSACNPKIHESQSPFFQHGLGLHPKALNPKVPSAADLGGSELPSLHRPFSEELC